MINVKIGRYAYSMSFVEQIRTFGPGANRLCVECQIYWWDNGIPVHFATGMSVLHPTDAHDPRKGAHKAAESALKYVSPTTRAIFHSTIESWFNNNGQDV